MSRAIAARVAAQERLDAEQATLEVAEDLQLAPIKHAKEDEDIPVS